MATQYLSCQITDGAFNCCNTAELRSFDMTHEKARDQTSAILRRNINERRTLLAVTSRYQVGVENRLVLLGFKAEKQWRNPTSGNLLTLWIALPRTLHEKRKAPRKAAKPRARNTGRGDT